MQERPTYAYIPPNVGGGDGGTFLGGAISIRNAIEAVVVFFISILLKVVIGKVIPFPVVGWIVVFIGIAFAIITVAGVNGEPMSLFLLNVINYRNRRVFVTLRPPVPKKKEEIKDDFGPGIDQKILDIFSLKKIGDKKKGGSK